jgi:hypothetical protein
MAQTKTAGSTSKRTSGRSPNGSRARSGSSRSGSRGSSASSRTRSAKSKATGKAASARSSARKSSNGLGNVVRRAKTPAIAGGAALVGLAGGLALNNGRKRSGFARARPRLNINMPRSRRSTAKVLGGAAKEIAKGGYKVGQLASEVQKVRRAVEAQD